MGLSVRGEGFGFYHQPPHLEAPHLRIQPTVDRKHSLPRKKKKKNSRKLIPKPEYKYLHSVYIVLGVISNLERI